MKNEKFYKSNKISLGTCYYPDQWPETMWENDIKRIAENGLETIRIADFSWSKFEPEEGKFTFDFFDRFLKLPEKYGLNVIFATPTAGPPAWLSQKYPEILNAKKDGTLLRHGMRRHYSYNSEKYRELSAIIVEKLISHYASFKCIIGYQIDNEFNCEVNEFYSESDHKAFRKFLQNKYKTLDNLNEAWGTSFWSQTYSDWSQVYLPRPAPDDDLCNPHMALDTKRFYSVSVISFCKMEADIIKKYKRDDQFITTNGIFGHLDSHKMTDENLDFISYDSYPNNFYDIDYPDEKDTLFDRDSSKVLSRIRSVSKNFVIMEQQAGAGGWQARMIAPAPKPGQMRLWTFQSIAHGADYVSFYRWRTACSGLEIYWHGLNNYDNKPNRRLAELKKIYEDTEKIKDIAGAKFACEVAVLKDYDNEWDSEFDKWLEPLSQKSSRGLFNAFELTHTPYDLVFISDETKIGELSKYKLLIYPHPAILTEKRAELLKEYVKDGGKIVFGARTGLKDLYGRCVMKPLPGEVSDLCGVRVSDFTLLGENDKPKIIFDEKETDAVVFCDILELSGAKVAAKFKGDYYDGTPAFTENKFGKGTAYYLASGFSFETAKEVLKVTGYCEPLKNFIELPEECEITVRFKDGKSFYFILNYKPYNVTCTFNKRYLDLIKNECVEGKCSLEGYGIMVLIGQ